MEVQHATRRSQRLQKIAHDLGIIQNADISPFTRPSKPPTFLVPDDERKADAILGQLKIEESASKSSSKGLKRVSLSFQKSAKPATYSYEELYAALTRVIEENGVAGVVEVLLNRFKGVQGNINLARRAITGVIKRIRNAENEEERGTLVQRAVEMGRDEFVQLLAPWADQRSLDEGLHLALERRDLGSIETLLRYGKQSWNIRHTILN